MAIAQRVMRHPRTLSALLPGVLLLTACGAGAMKVADSPHSGSTQASPGGYGGAPPSADSSSSGHASVAPRGEYIAEPAPDRPGLGTQWGEAVSAPVSFAAFVRAQATPWAEVLLHYNDARGAAAHAAYLGTSPAPLEVYAGDGSLTVALVDDYGNTLPGYAARDRSLVIGSDGARYKIVVRNGTTARFEIVASVDGLDVIDGKPADPNRRGYIVDPHGVLVIDGFRTSDDAVAAFRFGTVADSYAAQTSGDRNVGVIGLALFAERGAVWSPAELGRRDTADPFPSRGYAMPPR